MVRMITDILFIKLIYCPENINKIFFQNLENVIPENKIYI